VVPVGLVGADRLLPKGSPILRPAKLHVRFGPPVDLSDLRGQRFTREILAQACRQMAAGMRALLPPERQ